jgi:hypothetical protein
VATYTLRGGLCFDLDQNIIGVYSSLDDAMSAVQAIFDEDVQWRIFESPITPLYVGSAHYISKTGWALEKNARAVYHRIFMYELDALAKRPLTYAEQEAALEALSEEYAAAVDESEAGE